MSDFSYTEESEDESYPGKEEQIQQLINLTDVGTKKSEPETSTKSGKKKKKNPRERSEDLFKQFFELREFEKKLADTYLNSRKEKYGVKKPTKSNNELPSPEENEIELSDSSEHSSNGKEFSKVGISKKDKASNSDSFSTAETRVTERSVYELSERSASELSERSVSEETESSDSSRHEMSHRKSKQTSRNSSQNGSDHSSAKTSPVNSQTELVKIKNLCEKILRKQELKTRNRIIEPEEAMEERETRKYKTTKIIIPPRTPERKESLSSNSDISECSRNNSFDSEEMSSLKDFKHLPFQDNYFPKPSGSLTTIEEEKIGIESVTKQNQKTEQCEWEDQTLKVNFSTPNLIDQKEMDKVKNTRNLESFTSSEEPPKFHLQIVSKGATIEEKDDSKESCKQRQCVDKVQDSGENVSKQETNLNDTKERIQVDKNSIKERMEVDENSNEEGMEVNGKYTLLSNQCDDELIRQTVQELIEIQESTEVEDSTMVSQDIEDTIQQRGMGDGDKNTSYITLQERVDLLQEQIHNLRRQIEEARQYNQQEARDIAYMSNLLREQNTPIRNGLQWEEWELKEMVRERLKEKREAAAVDYQTRLRVVEALCSAELGRLEDALEALVPLNAAASSWDPAHRPLDLRSSWMTQDYFLEVVTSMNLSSSDEKSSLSAELSKNGELTTSVESKPESQ